MGEEANEEVLAGEKRRAEPCQRGAWYGTHAEKCIPLQHRQLLPALLRGPTWPSRVSKLCLYHQISTAMSVFLELVQGADLCLVFIHWGPNWRWLPSK